MRVFVALLAVGLLVGCAPQLVPQSTPTPEPVELVEVDQPAQVFGGDCSAMFSDAALSEALGQPVGPSRWIEPVSPETLLIEQVGGLHCHWVGADSSTVLYVTAVPAGAVGAPQESGCTPTMVSNTSCAVDVTANGIRLSGVVTGDFPGSDSLSRVDAVEALFAASANAAPVFVADTPIAGAWQNPVDCAAVAENVDWVALGGTADVVSDDTMGTDVYASAVERALRGGRVLGWCYLYSPKGSVAPTFWALGGGAWARDAVLAQDGATVLDVPGFDLVVETTGSWHTFDIFDGVNWIRVLASEPETLYPAVTAIINELDAQN
jgi:hypothetical protein